MNDPLPDLKLREEICLSMDWQLSKDGWAFERSGEKLNVTHRLERMVTLTKQQTQAGKAWGYRKAVIDAAAGKQPATTQGIPNRIAEIEEAES